MNREEWLQQAVKKVETLFDGRQLPEVYVSVGFPGGRGKKSTTVGQCWSSATSSDGKQHIFIHPVLDKDLDVLAVLVHELCHAIDDCESGHRGAFIELAKDVGLQKPWTATTASDELAMQLERIAEDLGPYPHASLVPLAHTAKQTTRMKKVICEESGYTVRMTKKWFEQLGYPSCPCHNEPMCQEGEKDEDSEDDS